MIGEQDGGGVGGRGVHLSPQIHQKYTFTHRNASGTRAESGQEYLTFGKEHTEPCKKQQDEGTRGELVGLDLTLMGGGTEARV